MTKLDAVSLVKLTQQLKRGTGAKDSEFFIAEGPQVVEMAIKAKVEIVAIFVSRSFDHALNIVGQNVIEVSDRDFEKMSMTITPQGILALVKKQQWNLSDIKLKSSVLLYLEEIRDPGNLGTMIRTADAFGADAVLLSPGCVDPTNDKVVRSSAGSIFNLPIVTDVTTGMLSDYSNKHSGEIIVTSLQATEYIEEVEQSKDKLLIWAIGNEASGTSIELNIVASRLVKIRMNGKAESLNAAIAAAVCLYGTMTKMQRAKA